MMKQTPCADCIYLVGAGPLREPHGALLRLENNGARDEFRCDTCEFVWSFGRLGWSRLMK
jgi:hypothetical protein